MTSKSKVVWQEGLLITPQHFQQQQRHVDYALNFKFEAAYNFGYGFSKLVLDRELLKLGRIGIKEATGIMPDGTSFDLPYQDFLPKPIEIKQINNAQSAKIYLSLPIVSSAISEIDNAQIDVITEPYRYKKNIHSIRDLHTKDGDYVQIELAQLTPRIMQGSEDLSAWTILPLGVLKEIRTDGTLIMDETFIPTILKVSVVPHVQSFLEEVANLIAERAKQLSERIGSPTQQGVTGIAEFLMLQLLNSAKAHYRHFAHTGTLHPENLYLMLTQICSELTTFTSESRVAYDFKHYNHDDLTTTFKDLMLATRQALSIVLTPRALPILLSKQNNLYVGVINDTELLKNANFVLAVKTNLPQEQLVRTFVQQTKVASPLTIDNLVRVQLAGISLVPLASAPPALPFHAGYSYFQLDSGSKGWEDVAKANSIAFHIAGNFTEINLQFWALRSK